MGGQSSVARGSQNRLETWTSFLFAFSALLPIVNPVGSALELLPLVGDAPTSVYRTLARRIAVDNIVFLLIIEILGSALLRFFGISIPIVEVSGGIVVSGLGWMTLNQPDPDGKSQEEKAAAKSVSEPIEGKYIPKVFYPFTFPITSGPGTVVTMLALNAHASHPRLIDSFLAHAGIFLAVLVITTCIYGCYAYAPRLAKIVSPNTIHGIVRIISFLMFSIGIQITWNGLSSLMRMFC